MVKHVILWTLKNEYSKEEKKQSRQKSKPVLRDLQVRFRDC